MWFLLIFMCIVSCYPTAQGEVKFFREGYRYVEFLESFYKIHTSHETWPDANRICSEEGAVLFYPKSMEQITEFITFLAIVNGTETYDVTTNELTNVISEGMLHTFDGIPLSELYSKWSPNPSENNKYPFICKKSYDSLDWNLECNLPILDYTYNPEMNRCYKFHLDPQNWTDAYDVCKQEQSYLAVINSPSEARVFVKLTEGSPKEYIDGNYLRGMVHLGFLNKNKQGWKSIDGKTLEASGYAQWSHDQPDGPARGVTELCGSMFYGGDLNDIGCQVKGFFICEHEIRPLFSLLGLRL